MNKIALLLALVVALSCVGCSANDGLLDDFYTLNIYPSENSTYDLGSTTYTWAEGYFGMIYLNGVAITSVGTGNVTAALNLTTAMIIRGDGGLKGVQTSLVSIDNFDNINTPGDLDAFDINAGNDLNCVNDLDVTDNADIGGDLDVTGASTFRDIVYFAGPYSRYYDDIEASYGNGSDYWDVYNSGATQFEFWTNDADGIGTDGIIYSVDDDTNTLSVTDDADIGGELEVVGDTTTRDIFPSDNNTYDLGAADLTWFVGWFNHFYAEESDLGQATVDNITASTSIWWHEYILPASAFSQGASGATTQAPNGNTLGGWLLDRDVALEELNSTSHVEADWDGASDPIVEIYFEVNVDNTSGTDNDTVDIQVIFRYKGDGETVVKTQTVVDAVVVGKSAQFKQFKAEIILNWDLAGNVLEALDVVSIAAGLVAASSEVTNIILNFAEFKYHTNKPSPEV